MIIGLFLPFLCKEVLVPGSYVKRDEYCFKSKYLFFELLLLPFLIHHHSEGKPRIYPKIVRSNITIISFLIIIASIPLILWVGKVLNAPASAKKQIESTIQVQLESAMRSSDKWGHFSYYDKSSYRDISYIIGKHYPTNKWHFFRGGKIVDELSFNLQGNEVICSIDNNECICNLKKSKVILSDDLLGFIIIYVILYMVIFLFFFLILFS